ncbi:MAG TPA: co-chaperone GroES [Planctomycetota bacterium]|nr:co-chaperone GroES [Planctomycetota bacterium]
MPSQLRPIRDKIVVERLEAEEKTAGGIVLPDTAKDKPQQGTIIAVGPGKLLDSGKIHEPEVKRGDRVIFSSFAGTEVKVEARTYLILSESEVLAVVEGADEKRKK